MSALIPRKTEACIAAGAAIAVPAVLTYRPITTLNDRTDARSAAHTHLFGVGVRARADRFGVYTSGATCPAST